MKIGSLLKFGNIHRNWTHADFVSHSSTPRYAPYRNVYIGGQEMSPAVFIVAPLDFPKPENSPNTYQEQNKLRYTDAVGYYTSKRMRKPRYTLYIVGTVTQG